MALALVDRVPVHPAGKPRDKVVLPTETVSLAEAPMVFNSGELRQLQQCYSDLLELHHAEVVDDEQFENAHRLLVEQVLPLRTILREQRQLIVDDEAGLTY